MYVFACIYEYLCKYAHALSHRQTDITRRFSLRMRHMKKLRVDDLFDGNFHELFNHFGHVLVRVRGHVHVHVLRHLHYLVHKHLCICSLCVGGGGFGDLLLYWLLRIVLLDEGWNGYGIGENYNEVREGYESCKTIKLWGWIFFYFWEHGYNIWRDRCIDRQI